MIVNRIPDTGQPTYTPYRAGDRIPNVDLYPVLFDLYHELHGK